MIQAADPASPPGSSNLCGDIDECLEDICGEGSCVNNAGSFVCIAIVGTSLNLITPFCQDIDECFSSTICGPDSDCTTLLGLIPILMSVSKMLPSVVLMPTAQTQSDLMSAPALLVIDQSPKSDSQYIHPCTDIDECSETPGICGQTKERAFLGNMDQQLKDNEGLVLPEPTVANSFSASMEVSGVGPRVQSSTVSSEGDGETGSVILGISDRLVSAMVQSDLSLETIGPGNFKGENTLLSTNRNSMEINLENLAASNNASTRGSFLGMAEPAGTQDQQHSPSPPLSTSPCLIYCCCGTDRYVEHELACTVMAGLIHFLVVASFVWMQLEALQLFLLVRRLSKVQVIQRDGLPSQFST
ncbi:hypothetical protein INR49_011213 [Caranx melampygus]|nr:hypothetical protein INR49_011213 [Caranx melampygus]